MVRKYNYENSDSDGNGTVWNFDDAEAQLIFNIKKEFISCLLDWDLEGAFWKIKTLITEGDALFLDTEKERLVESIVEINKVRNEYNNNYNPQEEDKGNYYMILEELYKQVCVMIKDHGLYFRERNDDRGL